MDWKNYGPSKSQVEVQEHLRQTVRTIEDVCQRFVGYPNSERTRHELLAEVTNVVGRIMRENGLCRPAPIIYVDTNPMDPSNMTLTFRHPDTHDLLFGEELHRYLGYS
jgi:hypothetical protein